jgi:hypothetical protein
LVASSSAISTRSRRPSAEITAERKAVSRVVIDRPCP